MNNKNSKERIYLWGGGGEEIHTRRGRSRSLVERGGAGCSGGDYVVSGLTDPWI